MLLAAWSGAEKTTRIDAEVASDAGFPMGRCRARRFYGASAAYLGTVEFVGGADIICLPEPSKQGPQGRGKAFCMKGLR